MPPFLPAQDSAGSRASGQEVHCPEPGAGGQGERERNNEFNIMEQRERGMKRRKELEEREEVCDSRPAITPALKYLRLHAAVIITLTVTGAGSKSSWHGWERARGTQRERHRERDAQKQRKGQRKKVTDRRRQTDGVWNPWFESGSAVFQHCL